MRLIGMQRGQQMGERRQPGGEGGSGKESVPTRLYLPGPAYARRFFPGGEGWGGGNNKIG